MSGPTLFSALAAVALLAAGSGVASASSPSPIGLSNDGVVWGDALTDPLFDSTARWVPGDTRAASFHVRNGGPTAAAVRIEIRPATGAGRLGPHDVEIAARAAGGSWHALANGTPSDWLTDRAIERGGQVRVEVRVRFRWGSSNHSMRAGLPLVLEVRLVEAAATEAGPLDDTTEALPEAGSGVSPLVVWLGTVLVGCGLALVAAGRRRPEVSVDG